MTYSQIWCPFFGSNTPGKTSSPIAKKRNVEIRMAEIHTMMDFSIY